MGFWCGEQQAHTRQASNPRRAEKPRQASNPNAATQASNPRLAEAPRQALLLIRLRLVLDSYYSEDYRATEATGTPSNPLTCTTTTGGP